MKSQWWKLVYWERFHIDSDFRYFSFDETEDGFDVYAYELKPTFYNGDWAGGDGRVMFITTIKSNSMGCSSSESLIDYDTLIAWLDSKSQKEEVAEFVEEEVEAIRRFTTAPQFLKKAADIMEERGKQYDSPGGERSMAQTVNAFNQITKRDLTESEGWLLMLILKQVRLFQRPGFHLDSAEDAVAYASLLAEAKQAEA